MKLFFMLAFIIVLVPETSVGGPPNCVGDYCPTPQAIPGGVYGVILQTIISHPHKPRSDIGDLREFVGRIRADVPQGSIPIPKALRDPLEKLRVGYYPGGNEMGFVPFIDEENRLRTDVLTGSRSSIDPFHIADREAVMRPFGIVAHSHPSKGISEWISESYVKSSRSWDRIIISSVIPSPRLYSGASTSASEFTSDHLHGDLIEQLRNASINISILKTSGGTYALVKPKGFDYPDIDTALASLNKYNESVHDALVNAMQAAKKPREQRGYFGFDNYEDLLVGLIREAPNVLNAEQRALVTFAREMGLTLWGAGDKGQSFIPFICSSQSQQLCR